MRPIHENRGEIEEIGSGTVLRQRSADQVRSIDQAQERGFWDCARKDEGSAGPGNAGDGQERN